MMSVGGSHISLCLLRRRSVAQAIATRVRAFLVQDDAATMAEYALLIALLSMVVALTLLNIATAVRTKFSSVSSCLAASSAC